jgi:hypothetical protein
MAELADHRLVLGYESAGLQVTLSADDGQTWTRGISAVTAAPGFAIANPFPLQLTDGTLLLAYRNVATAGGDFTLSVAASADQGQAWAYRSDIVSHDSQGVWEPFLMLMPDTGELGAFYARELVSGGPTQDIELKRSSDGGKTWSAAQVVSHRTNSRDGMPGVARLDGTTLMLIFEATDLARMAVRTLLSPDNGRTWQDLALVHDNGAYSGAPYVVRLLDGRLVASYQSHPANIPESQSTFGCVLSSDNGKAWADLPTPFAETGHLWNALFRAESGTLFALTGGQLRRAQLR